MGFLVSIAFGTWFYAVGDEVYGVLAFSLAGAILGFLRYNFHPAKIFMGDSGSLLIGFLIAVMAIELVEYDRSILPQKVLIISKPLLAMSILVIPLLDTARIFIYRSAKGMSPFRADKNHIHHKLLQIGLGHRGTVITPFDLQCHLHRHLILDPQPGSEYWLCHHDSSLPGGLTHLALPQTTQKMRSVSFLCLLLALTLSVRAQFGKMPLNRDYNAFVVGGLADAQYNFHPSIRPYEADLIDSLDLRLKSMDYQTNSTAIDLLFNADTMSASKDKFELSISPIIQSIYSFGRSNDSIDTGHNLGIGFRLFGYIGKRVTMEFDYVYSTNQYANYVEQEYIDQRGVIPGMGKALRRGNDYANKYYSGYLSYDAADFLNLEVGVGKHFIGNGYRSLLLSDNSFVYPYLRLTLDVWKLKYQVLYSMHDNVLYQHPDEIYKVNHKYSTSNLLSMNFGKRVNVGLFQTVVWYDNEETSRGFDVNYLNPVVFLRPIEYSIGSPDNVLMGLDMRYRFYKNYSVYGQVVLDEFLLNEIPG